MTDLRPAFDIRTGARTTLERILNLSPGHPARLAGLIVPDRLAQLTREAHPNVPINAEFDAGETAVLFNGRWARCQPAASALSVGEALIEPGSGTLLAAHAKGTDIPRLVAGDLSGMSIQEFSTSQARITRELISRPWHVRSDRDATLTFDLHALLIDRADIGTRDDSKPTPQIWLAPSSYVHPSVIFDDDPGAIIVDDNATIRPGAIIVGPAYIGPNSSVLEHSLIKAGTAIGPSCKVAGEVAGTIFQGFANKAHDGHIGDSWIGQWANLGAGTTNSNLLNTYGEVIVRTETGHERTGEQFLGAIIGDHVKTAICTRIMTGAIMNTGVMWASARAVTGSIPAMAWVTDEGQRKFRQEKFLEIAQTVMARRGVQLGDGYTAAIRTLLEQ